MLAVAIAAENKTTPREQWRRYLETEDRMRRCLKEMRRHYGRSMGTQAGLLVALHLLQQPLPEADPLSGGAARRLCSRLYEVLEIIEGPAVLTSED